ncbi:ER membrane protein complex subunit 5-like [Clavelina lepadiformis]|uniref:Membrane magnesium transporter n=1 Tax=Clavelina lepadiformis TaxID=159417 RepID=A0ABP0H5H1_CLALP
MSHPLKKVAIIVGLACIVHAGFSAAQHRSFVRLTEQEFSSLPLDIVVQSILGLFLASYGILMVSGDFKNIQVNADMKEKSFETVGNRFAFCTFEHRGKALYSRQ